MVISNEFLIFNIINILFLIVSMLVIKKIFLKNIKIFKTLNIVVEVLNWISFIILFMDLSIPNIKLSVNCFLLFITILIDVVIFRVYMLFLMLKENDAYELSIK